LSSTKGVPVWAWLEVPETKSRSLVELENRFFRRQVKRFSPFQLSAWQISRLYNPELSVNNRSIFLLPMAKDRMAAAAAAPPSVWQCLSNLLPRPRFNLLTSSIYRVGNEHVLQCPFHGISRDVILAVPRNGACSRKAREQP